MENRERDNIYAVPFIGGISCIISIFFVSITLNLISGMIILIIGLLEAICGIIMISSAIKMRSGKTRLSEERKKLMISSWFAVGISLGWAIINMLGSGCFVIYFEFGLVGGLLTILGIYFRDFISDPTLIQERIFSEPSPMKEEEFFANPKFCTNCGFNLEEGPFKFCPNCGNQMISE